MYIVSISPSSYNTLNECQMKYFIGNVLKIREPAGAAAEKGTIIHAFFEILAKHKKAQQDNAVNITHQVFGENPIPAEDPMQIDLDDLFDQCWEYYTKKSHNTFTEKDKKESREWAWTVFNTDEDPRKLHIISTEQYYSFPIEEEWAKYRYWSEEQNQEISGYYTINLIIDLIVQQDDTSIKFIDWKPLCLNTKIPTINGWTTMRDIKVGDIVFDQQGNQCSVIGKSKVNKTKCLKITFDDKSSVVCDKEHLWKLSDESVVEAQNLKRLDKINVTKPLQINDVELPIDPYILGLWLGDGRSSGGTITNADEHIWTEIEKRGYVLGNDISGKSKQNCQDRTIYGLTTKLKELNLYNNKHIPPIYLRASVNQRLELLRGLMDTDGNVNSVRKQAVFTTVKKDLSDQVRELILSLGQRVNQSNVISHGFGCNSQVFPLHFRPININPFLIPRKAERILPEWGAGKSSVRRIIQIEEIGEHETQCIAVDSPDNTFLCTDYMIPTHNSGQRKCWVTGKRKEYEDLYEDIQLNIYNYILHKLYPDKVIHVCIVYLKDGGSFDLIYTPESRTKTLQRVRDQFYKAREIILPEQNKSFKCKWCFYSKYKLPKATTEYRKGQFDDVGESMCLCSDVYHRISTFGLNDAIRQIRAEKDD